MNRIVSVFSALFLCIILKAQVEVPEPNNCRTLKKGRVTSCVDSNYEVVWTAAKMYGSDIEESIYFPPDSEFFKNIPVSMSEMWQKVENQVRFWSIEFDSLYVVTGKILYKPGTDKPEVTAYYKAILKGCQGDAIGFFMDETREEKQLDKYTVPIDKLEGITGMDYFSTLDETLQEIIEPEFDPKFWPFSVLDFGR